MKGVCIDNSGDDRGSRKTGKFHRNESAAAAAATAAPPALPAHTPGFWIFPPMEKTTNSKVTATVFLCDNLFCFLFFQHLRPCSIDCSMQEQIAIRSQVMEESGYI